MRTTSTAADVKNRRAFLQIGSAGLLGLTLPNLLRLEAQGESRPASGRRARGVIVVYLDGGPSTIDMWDMKPEAPAEVRGEFRPAPTAVPGVRICEHLPKLARVMDRVTLVRSLHHVIDDHFVGSRYVLTGRIPARGAELPALASLSAALLTPTPGIPPAFTLVTGLVSSQLLVGPGRLGASYGALTIDLGSGLLGRRLEGFSLPDCLSVSELEERERLRRRLDRAFTSLDRSGLPARLDRFQQEALDILRSDKIRRALEVESEPSSVRKAYGLLDTVFQNNDSPALAKGLLAARRLIEAGARFVTVGSLDSWDTHSNLFSSLRNGLLPTLDRALPALIADLDQRGLLAETVVYCIGEFGRTPKVNSQGGRDHWPRAMAALLAGGGFRRGYVHGTTDRHGAAPASDPCTPEDMAATIFDRLGFPPSHRLATLRESSIFPAGRVLRQIVES